MRDALTSSHQKKQPQKPGGGFKRQATGKPKSGQAENYEDDFLSESFDNGKKNKKVGFVSYNDDDDKQDAKA